MKTCRTCGEEKPSGDFYARTPNCKRCFNDRLNQRRRGNAEWLKDRSEYMKRLRQTVKSPKARERRHAVAYRERYPEKTLAKRAVRAAIVSGILSRPTQCEGCGSADPRGQDGRSLIQAHHHDYSQPLAVEWLCANCHAAEHRRSLASPREETEIAAPESAGE
jgi:hypothetical protein